MMIRFNNPCSGTTSTTSNNDLGVNDNSLTPTKKKYRKKPDPCAPKITRPCSECGKKFWSWKALFGHMRCHPERQWRGINPPPNLNNRLQKEAVTSTSDSSYNFSKMTEDDHDAALSLLLLASGAHCHDQSPSVTTSENVVAVREGVVMGGCGGGGGDVEVVLGGDGGNSCRFECSSCKKVFGSHQALGGHRASHKNVKGCFANTRTNDGVVLEEELSSRNLQDSDGGGIIVVEDETDKMLMLGLGMNLGIHQHKCNICFRVFPSGQALGGHKRCHWEKFDDNNNNESSGIDLNTPSEAAAAAAPPQRMFESPSWSLEAMDLRLGL